LLIPRRAQRHPQICAVEGHADLPSVCSPSRNRHKQRISRLPGARRPHGHCTGLFAPVSPVGALSDAVNAGSLLGQCRPATSWKGPVTIPPAHRGDDEAARPAGAAGLLRLRAASTAGRKRAHDVDELAASRVQCGAAALWPASRSPNRSAMLHIGLCGCGHDPVCSLLRALFTICWTRSVMPGGVLVGAPDRHTPRRGRVQITG
jgi:hypothetical protein